VDDKTSTSPSATPSRRRIVDFAQANALRAGEGAVDLNAMIDAPVTEGMIQKERRSRGNVMKKPQWVRDKSYRGNASQFFVAGELCRRGHAAVVTLGNTPNTDILCSNAEGTRFVHIQVKTYVPGKSRTCSVGTKAELVQSPNFFWVLCGIPEPSRKDSFAYYVIPAIEMAKNVRETHGKWLNTPGKKGQAHKDSTVRVVFIPPNQSPFMWNIAHYREAWHLIEEKLGG
jgi:hypothetical protein